MFPESHINKCLHQTTTFKEIPFHQVFAADQSKWASEISLHLIWCLIYDLNPLRAQFDIFVRLKMEFNSLIPECEFDRFMAFLYLKEGPVDPSPMMPLGLRSSVACHGCAFPRML